MNTESPFRISSLVLTLACLLCGITAASILAPKFMPHRNLVDQATIAAIALQGSLSEFQTTGSPHLAPGHPATEASRSQLFSAATTATASVPARRPGVPTAALHPDRRNMLMISYRDEDQANSEERVVSPVASQGDSVPQFYAPVTVHPVTVNIDNAGIIRAISQVHERLDLLSAETRPNARAEAP